MKWLILSLLLTGCSFQAWEDFFNDPSWSGLNSVFTPRPNTWDILTGNDKEEDEPETEPIDETAA